jgi:hypothetical protein
VLKYVFVGAKNKQVTQIRHSKSMRIQENENRDWGGSSRIEHLTAPTERDKISVMKGQ